MADLDLVMTAAAPSEAPAIDAVGKFATFERPMLTMPFNVTGTPAMSVCCGYSPAGLPLAFQLVRQAVRRGDGAAGRARLRDGDAVALGSPAAGRVALFVTADDRVRPPQITLSEHGTSVPSSRQRPRRSSGAESSPSRSSKP